jgi:uncharacterized membrane protein
MDDTSAHTPDSLQPRASDGSAVVDPAFAGGPGSGQALGGGPPAGTTPPAGGLPEGLISGALHDGWAAFKRDPLLLMGLNLTMLVLVILAFWVFSGGVIGSLIYNHHGGWHDLRNLFLVSIVGLVQNLLTAGMLYVSLCNLRRESVPFATLFAGFRKFVPLTVVHVVVDALISVGIFLLLIPGIFVALAFGQWPFLIMDRNLGILDSLEGSWKMMKGYKGEFLLLWLVLIAINIVGLIPLGIGLLFTVPLTYSIQAAFYDRVLKLNPPAVAAAA